MASELKLSLRDGVRTIQLYKPKKMNAISSDGYQQIANVLNEDAKNDNIIITIITGTGKVFTSGNDLTSSMSKMDTMTFEEIIDEGWHSFKNMIEAIINYPKLLITVVNGPAYGIGLTICSLCDITYASDTATFQAPFVKLGLCIEGCGSYLIPRILGRSKASEVLLLGKKMSASEALQFHFISKIVPFDEIPQFIEELHKLGKLPLKSVIVNKRLITANLMGNLKEAMERECKQLIECQHSEEFLNNIMAFSQRSKL